MLYAAAHDDQSIIALCTPRGSGAIALLRISGSDSIAIADRIAKLSENKKLVEQVTHTIYYGQIVDHAGIKIDQVLFLLMRAPHTFTGQDTVEITCHNNPFIIEKIIESALRAGARLAHEGEFAKRAYMQGKIDLVQAEAIDDLIRANTQLALQKALAQMSGSFSSWVLKCERLLVKALAWCEASFEFLDEGGDFNQEVAQIVQEVQMQVRNLCAGHSAQKQIREGVRIALIGSVNAGKSSLFNALLQQERAIVSPKAGTTRDTIESGIYRNGAYWTLIDTAGLRQADESIEQEGIERSLKEAKLADIIMLVFDGSRNLMEQEQEVYTALIAEHAHKIVPVLHKADLPRALHFELPVPLEFIAASSNYEWLPNIAHQENMKKLFVALDTQVAKILTDHNAPFLVNKRQYHLLTKLDEQLSMLLELCVQPVVQYELLSIQLRDALEQLSGLTGKSVSEAGLDAVFKEFCVGK